MEENNQRKQWDSTYSTKDNFFGEGSSDFGRRALDIFKRERVENILELGCGQGRDTWLFASAGMHVTALDYSEPGICQMRERAKDLCLDPNVTCVVQDVRSGIPLPDNSVDAIFSNMFFTMQLWEKEIEFILNECRRVLKPGGLNIYSVRNYNDPHFQKGPHKGEDMWQNAIGFVVHYFSEDKIRRLSKGYEIVHIVEFDDPSPPFTKKLYEVLLKKV